MAGRQFDLSIIINALDKTQSTFSNLDKNLGLTTKQLTTVSLAATAAFAAMVYVLKKAADAAAEQQAQEIKLAGAMINANIYTDEAFKSNVKLADSLQWVSNYSDEAIISAEAMIGSFVKDNAITQELTKSTMDLAAKKGIDLESAAALVAKTVGSETNALARMGIVVEGAAGSTERATMAMQGIASIAGGAAYTATLGYTGQMEILKKRIGEAQEEIGLKFLPMLTKLTTLFSVSVSQVMNFINSNQQLVGAITSSSLALVGLIAGFTGTVLLLPKLIAGFQTLYALILSNPFIAITAAILTLILNWNKLRNAIDETTTVGKVIGIVMDTLKASFLAIATTLNVLILQFKGLWQAMTLNFSGAKQSIQEAANLITNLPRTIQSAYSKIDTSTKQSINTRTSYEKDLAAQIKILLANKVTDSVNANAILTNDEKKMKEAVYKNNIAIAQANKDLDLQTYNDSLLQYQTYLESQESSLALSQYNNLAAQTLYYENLAAQREIDKQLELNSQFTIAGGFSQMLAQMSVAQTNWYTVANSLRTGFISSFTTGFTTMFNNIGNGWEKFAEGFKQIGDGMKNAIIQAMMQMAATWVVQHGIMIAASLAWKGIEIVAAAAVAAARAAAAMAWTLWGAIAIGAAIGFGVLKMANAFASGTRGFSGGIALVGENGPELVNLPNGSDVMNNAETRNILNSNKGTGSGNAINVNIDFGGSTFMGTVDEITEALSNKIYKNLKLNAVI